MNEITTIHEEAMDLADQAYMAKRHGDGSAAAALTQRAFELEFSAAEKLRNNLEAEPTRSVLYRSAASLAIDLNDFRNAERCIAIALSGNPPQDIADELRDLLNQVYTQKPQRAREIEPDSELTSDTNVVSLVHSVQQKDYSAVGLLYDIYAEPLFRYFYFRTNDRLESEELVSEVFLKVVETIGEFKLPDQGQARTFNGWIFRIANNKVMDAYRDRKRQFVEQDESIPASQADEDGLASTLNNEELRAAIQRLTPAQQQVVLLRYIERMSIDEVARMTGRTAGAVRVMQHRALKAIAKLISEGRKAQAHRAVIAMAELIGEAA